MQVVSFDPRGYGQSRPPRRDFPVDFYQQAADDATRTRTRTLTLTLTRTRTLTLTLTLPH